MVPPTAFAGHVQGWCGTRNYTIVWIEFKLEITGKIRTIRQLFNWSALFKVYIDILYGPSIVFVYAEIN